jgi:hypothetical protein
MSAWPDLDKMPDLAEARKLLETVDAALKALKPEDLEDAKRKEYEEFWRPRRLRVLDESVKQKMAQELADVKIQGVATEEGIVLQPVDVRIEPFGGSFRFRDVLRVPKVRGACVIGGDIFSVGDLFPARFRDKETYRMDPSKKKNGDPLDPDLRDLHVERVETERVIFAVRYLTQVVEKQ